MALVDCPSAPACIADWVDLGGNSNAEKVDLE